MIRERLEELWAAACIRSALPEVDTAVHDDGSRPSMYDLDLIRNGFRFGACKVTAAADGATIELWNLVNGQGRLIIDNLHGGWMVNLSPHARVNHLRRHLPQLLRQLESESDCLLPNRGQKRSSNRTPELERLGIINLSQRGTSFPGSVYFTVSLPAARSGGAVPRDGDEVPRWLTQWLATPAQRHNIDKLLAAKVDERHVFIVFPGFTPAPFSVSDVLMRADGPLPSIAPVLADGITHLWTMSSWSSGNVLAWNATSGWTRHDKPMNFD